VEDICQINLLKLQAGKLALSVAPQIGGSIASFTTQTDQGDVDIFRPLKVFDCDPRHVLGMGCFPLVPYSNRILDGKFYGLDGVIEIPNNCKPDTNPCHGTGWQTSWNVLDVTSNSAILELEPDYNHPLHYRARQVLHLTPDALEITLSVKNLCSITFPVGLGLHPYFPGKTEAVITAQIPNEWVLDQESMPLHCRKNADLDAFLSGKTARSLKEMSAYSDWQASAKITWPSRNVSVTIATQPNVSHLLMWAPPEEDFFCVEPVSHAIDGFNLAHEGHENVGGFMLANGETYSREFIFTIEST
jgi:aldose 1-epimerase